MLKRGVSLKSLSLSHTNEETKEGGGTTITTKTTTRRNLDGSRTIKRKVTRSKTPSKDGMHSMRVPSSSKKSPPSVRRCKSGNMSTMRFAHSPTGGNPCNPIRRCKTPNANSMSALKKTSSFKTSIRRNLTGSNPLDRMKEALNIEIIPHSDNNTFETSVKRCIQSEFMLLASQDEVNTSQEDYFAMDHYRVPSIPGRQCSKAGSVATWAFLEMLFAHPRKFVKPTSRNGISCHEVLKQLPKRIEQASKVDSAKPTISSSRPLTLAKGEYAPFSLVPPGYSGTHRALLVGVVSGGRHGDLKAPPNDIGHMKHFLIQHAGFETEQVTVLLEGTSRTPTKANILAEFQKLVRHSKAQDTCFIQFSGHGGRTSHNLHIVPSDFAKAGPIRDEDIMRDLIKAMPAGVHTTMLIDCCFSGTLGDLPYVLKSHASKQEIEMYFDTDTRQEMIDQERTGGEVYQKQKQSRAAQRLLENLSPFKLIEDVAEAMSQTANAAVSVAQDAIQRTSAAAAEATQRTSSAAVDVAQKTGTAAANTISNAAAIAAATIQGLGKYKDNESGDFLKRTSNHSTTSTASTVSASASMDMSRSSSTGSSHLPSPLATRRTGRVKSSNGKTNITGGSPTPEEGKFKSSVRRVKSGDCGNDRFALKRAMSGFSSRKLRLENLGKTNPCPTKDDETKDNNSSDRCTIKRAMSGLSSRRFRVSSLDDSTGSNDKDNERSDRFTVKRAMSGFSPRKLRVSNIPGADAIPSQKSTPKRSSSSRSPKLCLSVLEAEDKARREAVERSRREAAEARRRVISPKIPLKVTSVEGQLEAFEEAARKEAVERSRRDAAEARAAARLQRQ